MHKRFMSLGIAAVLIAGLLSACQPAPAGGDASDAPSQAPAEQTSAASEATPQPAAPEEGNFTELGTYPIVKEKETITIFCGIGDPTRADIETYPQQIAHEERTNVSVAWKTFPYEQFKEKVTLAFAGGEKIDLILRGNSGQTAFSMTEVAKYADQDFVLPLGDLIQSDTVNLKARVAQNPDWITSYTTPDGNVYAIPSFSETYHVLSPNKMYVNRSFLTNLGLEEPKTTEEFENYLKEVIAKDANGNGDPNDEIGLVGCAGVSVRLVSTFLMHSAFAFDDGADRLYLDGGVVKAGFMDDGFRDGLVYLNALYKQGLIYQGSFTQDVATATKLNSQKYESISGALANQHYGTVGTRAEGEPSRQSEYMAIGPVKGPSGRQSAYWAYYSPFISSSGGAGLIPTTCKDPALVMRYMDYFYSDEGTVDQFLGLEGLHWEKAKDGDQGIDGRPALYTKLTLAETDPNYGKFWDYIMPMYVTSDLRLSITSPADEFAQDGSGAEAHYYNATRDKYAPYAMPIEEVLPPLYYTEEQISDIAQHRTTINAYVEESIVRFIVGDEVDPMKDWDAFQSELKNLGVEDYLKIVQSAYDVSAYKK